MVEESLLKDFLIVLLEDNSNYWDGQDCKQPVLEGISIWLLENLIWDILTFYSMSSR